MARRKHAVIDAETDPFKKGRLEIKPFIWGFYDGDTYLSFQSTKELIEFLQGQHIVVYAHNGGKFDYHFFLEYLEPFTEIMLINGRIASFKIGECEFRDSYNILPVPLKTFAKTEIDYSKFEANVRHLHMEEIESYLKDDCVFLYEFVTQFIDTYGMNLTLAGSAMKQWKKISDLDIPKSDEMFYGEFSKYYYGGRVQCFKTGEIKNDFRAFDIVSAYPYAMLHRHPYSINHVTWKSKEISGQIREQDFYSIRAFSNGALPFRGDNGLCFPNDDIPREYHVTGWELKAGIEAGTVRVLQWLEAHTFCDLIDFTPYVDHFFAMKNLAKKGSAEYTFAKLFLNSLYGKWGSNPGNYEKNMIIDTKFIAAADMNEDGWEFAGELGPWGLMKRDLEEDERRYYNVATAASITGFVRAYLYKHLYQIEKAGGQLLYCDTDSISFAGPSGGFDIGTELGQWELEGNFDYGAIAGKKLYAFRYGEDIEKKKKGEFKTATKGVKLTAAELIRVAKGEEILFESEVPVYSAKKAPRLLSRKVRKTAFNN